MTRVLPPLVSFVGSLGLALAFGYLLLIVRAFQPGGDEIVDFLIGTTDEELSFGFLVVLVPYALLMAHLWLRIRVGAWLVEKGDLEAARKYASKRLRPGVLRARKEALAHRIVLLRVALREVDYVDAWRLCEEADKLPRDKDFLLEFRRWQLETALRRDNLVDAHRVIDEIGVPKSRSGVAAAFCAAAAEVYLREDDEPTCEEWLRRAVWADTTVGPRLHATRGLAAARFGRTPDEWSEGAEALERASGFLDDVPGAAGEVFAIRARLAELTGEPQRAQKLLAQARRETNDSRSDFVVSRVAARAGAETEGLQEAREEE